LAACTTSGTPVGPGDNGQSAPPGASTTRASGGSQLHDLDPCGLLTPAEEQQLGAPKGQRQDVRAARLCAWTVPGSHSFDIAIFEDKSAKDLFVETGRRSSVTIGRHRGEHVEADGGEGKCMITLDVTQHSSVSTDVSARLDTAKACDAATKVATLFEPKLP
jgi:hypothetical protein